MPSPSRPSNAYRSMTQDDPQSSKPLRYLVRHYHQPDSAQRREEVIVTYSGDLPDAWLYAVNTASRYQGVIYVEYSPEEPYQFVRSYAKRRAEDDDSVDLSSDGALVAAGGVA